MPEPAERTSARRTAERGSFVIEAALATVVLAVSLFAVAGTMSTSLSTSSKSKQINHGARFLEAVMSSLDEQSYDALLAMSGNVFHDGTSAGTSRHRVELTTNRAGIDRIEVMLVLRQQQSGQEVARVATIRSRR
jgi:Tfp pilus assembly protein PilV